MSLMTISRCTGFFLVMSPTAGNQTTANYVTQAESKCR